MSVAIGSSAGGSAPEGPAMRVNAAGAMQLTRMPCFAPAVLRLRIIPTTPPLAVAYARFPGRPSMPVDVVITTRPYPCSTMVGHAARTVWNEPSTCTARWASSVVGVDLGHARPAHDPRVVDDDVDAAVLVDRGGDECLGPAHGGDVVLIRDRGAPGRDDLGDDVGRGPGVGADPRDRAAEVVDHHRGAPRRRAAARTRARCRAPRR